MQIKLTNLYAGPKGTWPAGTVLSTDRHISMSEATALLDGKYAETVKEVVVETADVKPEETTSATPVRKKRGAFRK